MKSLQILPTIEQRPEARLFKQAGVKRVSRKLGISTSYLYGILSGIHTPGEKLDHKIKQAADDLKNKIEMATMESKLSRVQANAKHERSLAELHHKLDMIQIKLDMMNLTQEATPPLRDVGAEQIMESARC